MEGESALETKTSPDAGTALCDHIKKQGFQCRLFSDITVVYQGKDYPLHRIILSQSPYFHSLLSGPWKENGKTRVELHIDDPMVTSEGLECAFSFMYGVIPTFTAGNVISVLAAGCFLGLENLCESSVQFALNDLKVDTFARYNHLSEKHCYGRFARCLQNACWSLLCTHASRELLHYLPNLSLEVLCHLLKSDELWVLNEAERYKLAKQALIDWRLARTEPMEEREAGNVADNTPRKRGKSMGPRKTCGSRNPRTRTGRSARSVSKDRSSKRKEGSALHLEARCTADIPKEDREMDLKCLRRIWENDANRQFNGVQEGFALCSEIFTAGGIVFAHLEVNDILHVKRELEDANLSSDVANDSIWHHVLLEDHILKLKHSSSAGRLPSDSDNDEDDEDDDMEEDDENDEEEDDEDSSDLDSSESDRWSTDNGDDSNSSDGREQECSSRESRKVPNSSLVSFSSFDVENLECPHPGRRKTTGGFTWSAKPDINMQLVNFPPFRFGAEFVMKDKTWTPCLDSRSREVFYGGSTWYIQVVTAADSLECIRCQLCAYERGVYKDTRKDVRYRAKLFTKTISGLRCVAGVGVRSTQRHARQLVSMLLARDDVLEDEPLRISCVVQLIDVEST